MTDYENNPSGMPEPNHWQTEPNQQPPYPDMPPMERKPKNRYASTALMFGVFSLITLCSFMFPMAIVMGVSAACFAILSKNKNEAEQQQNMSTSAKVGFTLGTIATALGVIEYFVMLNVYDMMKDPELIPYFNDAFQKLQEYMQQNMV